MILHTTDYDSSTGARKGLHTHSSPRTLLFEIIWSIHPSQMKSRRESLYVLVYLETEESRLPVGKL